CASSWIARYTIDGILVNFSDRLNSPAGITFDPDGMMYVVDRECGEQVYRVYTIDRSGAKNLFNDEPVGQDPNITLAQLTHDIAWSPDGLAITGTLDNSVYRFKKKGLTPPRGEHSTLIGNSDGTYTRTLKNGTTIGYDSNGYQTSWTDRNANATDYIYDSGGKLRTITDPAGKVTTFNYNNGKLQSIRGPAGRTTIFQHDANGNLTSITDPDSAATNYAYDNNRMLTSKTVPTGETYIYEYDTYGRIVKSTSPNGEVRQYKSGKMAVVVNGLPAGEGTIANPAKLKSTSLLVNTYTDSQGSTVNTTIDIDGYVTKLADPLSRITSYERDKDRNITRITRPNGEVESMTYDNTGNLLTTATASTGATTTFIYEPIFNNIASIKDPKGNTTTMEYDTKGNLTKITDPLNNETIMSYDSRGLLTSTTDALTNNSTFTYDGSGNLASATDPLDNSTIFSYDAAGNLDSTTDARVKTTAYEYDTVNNLIKTTAADSAETSFTYGSGERCQPCGAANGGDLLTSLTDANNNTTTFDYNEIGQLSTTINPAGLVTAYDYDTDRKLISKRDPNLQTTAYQYDDADRLTQKTLPSDTVKYTYNSSGSLTSVEDTDSLVFLDYDLQNRLILENALDNTGSITITQDLTISDNPGLDDRDIIVDGATLTVNGAHTFKNLTLTNNATLTHSDTTTTDEYRLDVTVTNSLTIDTTSSIDVSGRGYLGGRRGDNNSGYGRTIGNTNGSYAYSAGSYGGLGGKNSSYQINAVYGSIVNPDELGSGGGSGSTSYSGGDGGGLVKIVANDIALDGSINANGGNGSSYNNGGGSGGGVYIEVSTLSGIGVI
ncbi:MAG: RHS repeat protein, partial [Planctomycetes bacterium]|nr:RHS repeat protein [Planctomycetota bacterium]